MDLRRWGCCSWSSVLPQEAEEHQLMLCGCCRECQELWKPCCLLGNLQSHTQPPALAPAWSELACILLHDACSWGFLWLHLLPKGCKVALGRIHPFYPRCPCVPAGRVVVTSCPVQVVPISSWALASISHQLPCASSSYLLLSTGLNQNKEWSMSLGWKQWSIQCSSK